MVPGGEQSESSSQVVVVSQRPVTVLQVSFNPSQASDRQPGTQLPSSHTVEGGLHWESRVQPAVGSQRPVAVLQVSAPSQPVERHPGTQLPTSQMVDGGLHWESSWHWLEP